jgi:hypothetical protein
MANCVPDCFGRFGMRVATFIAKVLKTGANGSCGPDIEAHISDGEYLMASKQKMVTAVFRDRHDANAAWSWLTARGYTPDEINMLMSESTKTRYYSQDEEEISASSHAAEGVAAGGAIGTAVGAAAAAIAAIGTTLVIPGGIFIAGPIAAALAGGGAGAVVGGVIGGLVGLGIPESNARAYEEVLRDGGVAIGVVPHNAHDASAIKKKFEEFRGDNIITI